MEINYYLKALDNSLLLSKNDFFKLFKLMILNPDKQHLTILSAYLQEITEVFETVTTVCSFSLDIYVEDKYKKDVVVNDELIEVIPLNTQAIVGSNDIAFLFNKANLINANTDKYLINIKKNYKVAKDWKNIYTEFIKDILINSKDDETMKKYERDHVLSIMQAFLDFCCYLDMIMHEKTKKRSLRQRIEDIEKRYYRGTA